MERFIYICFFFIKKLLKLSPLYFYFEALERLNPVLGLKLYNKKQKKLDNIYAVPYVISPTFRYNKAIN